MKLRVGCFGRWAAAGKARLGMLWRKSPALRSWSAAKLLLAASPSAEGNSAPNSFWKDLLALLPKCRLGPDPTPFAAVPGVISKIWLTSNS